MKQERETVQFAVKPSVKLIQTGYTAAFIVLFLAVLGYTNNPDMQKLSAWVLFVPALLLLWPLKYDLRRRFTQLTLAGDKLRYETGMLNRSKRAIQLTKVQNVRVDQTVAQRLLRTGDISVETAGETSLLTIRNVDNPDAVTDYILRAAHPEIGERKAGQRRG